jgi:hypothetical protein
LIVRRKKIRDRGQKSEVGKMRGGRQETGVRGQKTEVRGQNTEDRGQGTGDER